jgi:hypothetical protein
VYWFIIIKGKINKNLGKKNILIIINIIGRNIALYMYGAGIQTSVISLIHFKSGIYKLLDYLTKKYAHHRFFNKK